MGQRKERRGRKVEKSWLLLFLSSRPPLSSTPFDQPRAKNINSPLSLFSTVEKTATNKVSWNIFYNYSKLLVLLAKRAETHRYILIHVPNTEHSFMKLGIGRRETRGRRKSKGSYPSHRRFCPTHTHKHTGKGRDGIGEYRVIQTAPKNCCAAHTVYLLHPHPVSLSQFTSLLRDPHE